MWIVVVVEPFYPSVYHFDNEEDAREKYNHYRGEGFATHLAKVEETEINHEYMDGYSRSYKEPKDLDVDW